MFDVDGTLLDSVDLHARAWAETFAHFGKDISVGAIRSQIGKGGDQLMPVFLDPAQIERQGPEMEEYRKKLFDDKYLRDVRPFPSVRELFERIRADGKRIALASSANREDVAAYKQIAGIADLVEAGTTSDDADKSKPHPDIFLAALDQLGNPKPDQVISIGDAPYDAEAACKASISPIGVLSGGFSETSLRTAGCIAIYRDLSDLLRHYEGSPLTR